MAWHGRVDSTAGTEETSGAHAFRQRGPFLFLLSAFCVVARYPVFLLSRWSRVVSRDHQSQPQHRPLSYVNGPCIFSALRAFSFFLPFCFFALNNLILNCSKHCCCRDESTLPCVSPRISLSVCLSTYLSWHVSCLSATLPPLLPVYLSVRVSRLSSLVSLLSSLASRLSCPSPSAPVRPFL